MGITEVPRNLTPAALPLNLIPDLVITVQPGDMVFTTPAPLSLPNLAGYEAGTQMDLWSINPPTGFFDNVGVGQVSADRSVINTISGGIRNSSWHFFADIPNPVDKFPTFDPNCNDCADLKGITSQANTGSGGVVETHELVSYQSLGETRALQLVYNSENTAPSPIVPSSFTSNLVATSGVGNPQVFLNNRRLTAELTMQLGGFAVETSGNQGGLSGLSGGENFWKLNGNTSGDIALQADLRDSPSGVYQYQMRSGTLLNNSTTNILAGTLSTTTGDVTVINKTKSAFGSGWNLSGLQEIVVNPDRSVLLIDGAGSDLIFKYSVTGYISPAGEMSVLEKLADGTFKLTSKDKAISQFDAQNRLVSVTDRNGNQTRHIYTA